MSACTQTHIINVSFTYFLSAVFEIKLRIRALLFVVRYLKCLILHTGSLYMHREVSSQSTGLAGMQHPWRNLEFNALFKGTLKLFDALPPFTADYIVLSKTFLQKRGGLQSVRCHQTLLWFRAMFKGTLTWNLQLVLSHTWGKRLVRAGDWTSTPVLA